MSIEIRYPPWLEAPPDGSIDHNYLTQREIDQLPSGVFYKRKSTLTRHRFAKAEIWIAGDSRIIEVIDDRGHWRISAEDTEWICARANGKYNSLSDRELEEIGASLDLDAEVRSKIAAFRCLGLPPQVLPSAVPIPPGRVRHPCTLQEMKALYADYTDMEEQGHFDDDSPDLARMQLMLDWTPPGCRVLDLGCNSGAFGVRLLHKRCTVVGLDLSQPLLRKARGKGVPTICAFAESLPFRDRVFDVVLCGELLEHVLQPCRVVAEAMRVLQPGGMLICSVPHADGDWGLDDIGHHEEHLTAYSPDALTALFLENGFMVGDIVVQEFNTARPQGLAATFLKPR